MADPERPFPARLLAALVLSSTLAPLNSTMLSVVLGSIGQEFHATPAELTRWLVTTYLVTSIVMQAPGGKLGDTLGHRRMLGAGQVLVALGSLAAIVAPSALALAGARVLMAAGGALIVPSASALLRLELPAHRRARAFGMFGACMALGAAAGPLLGGALEALHSWRATFVANLAVIPVAAWLARGAAVPAGAGERAGAGAAVTAEHPRLRFDVVGSLLLGAALTLFVLGAGRELGGGARAALLGGGAALTFAFVAWEGRQRDPVLDLGLLRVRVLVAGGALIALHNFAMYAFLFEFPVVLRLVLGLDVTRTGSLMASMMVAMVVASPLSGRAADRVGARAVVLLGTVVSLGAMLSLRWTPLASVAGAGELASGHVAWLIPSLVGLGLGLGMAGAPAQAAAMSAAPREQSGMAAGLLATFRYLGGVGGTLVLGLLWSGRGDRGQVMAEHQGVVLVFAGALAVALGAAAQLPGHGAAREG